LKALWSSYRIAAWSGFLLLAGCSGVPVSGVPGSGVEQAEWAGLHESRCDDLQGVDQWKLEGRIAINDGRDGGSGRFNWQTVGEDSSMEFHGALGRGAWRLQTEEGGAVLELANGEVRRAASVGLLVEQALGWEIPVDALAWWVRGCAAPGDRDRRRLDEHGWLTGLSQFGWEIEYEKYADVNGVFMPLKLKASQDTHMVKLAVRDWLLGRDPGRSE
jgi:outer membrane lipoprotein LolB